jgi:hypothetical protein
MQRKTANIDIRVEPQLVEKIDAWRDRQRTPPSRSAVEWVTSWGPVRFHEKKGDAFELSASDLVGYLYCCHLSALDRAVGEGALQKPLIWDPLLEVGRCGGPLDDFGQKVDYYRRCGLDQS